MELYKWQFNPYCVVVRDCSRIIAQRFSSSGNISEGNDRENRWSFNEGFNDVIFFSFSLSFWVPSCLPVYHVWLNGDAEQHFSLRGNKWKLKWYRDSERRNNNYSRAACIFDDSANKRTNEQPSHPMLKLSWVEQRQRMLHWSDRLMRGKLSLLSAFLPGESLSLSLTGTTLPCHFKVIINYYSTFYPHFQ